MDAPTTVRAAVRSDLEALAQMNAEVQHLHARAMSSLFKMPDLDAVRRQFEAWLDTPQMRIGLAEVDGRHAGYTVSRVRHKHDNPFRYAHRVVTIDQICVRSSVRRKGVGRRLIDAVRAWARDLGVDRVELDVWDFNGDAQAFFESQGFQTTQRFMALAV